MRSNRLFSIAVVVVLSTIQIMAQKVTIKNSNEPKARMYHSLFYHPKTDCFLLFAGFIKHGWKPDLRDIWKYDPKKNNWEEVGICEAVAADSSSGIAGMAYDEESDQFITIDVLGRTWSYNFKKNKWKNMDPNQSPSGRAGQGMVYDKESDRIIMFGGFGAKNVNDTTLSDTWTYDYNSNNWTKMHPRISPSARMYFAMTYDNSNDKAVLWGGRKQDPISDNRIWTYDYNTDTWVSKINIGGPAKPLAYPSMVYRGKYKDIILFGGAILESIFKGNPIDSTWSYNLKQNKWNKLSPKVSPIPVANHSMAYDLKRKNILMFGGEQEALYSNKVSGDLWLYDSKLNTWIKK